jgi:hypothetical protein
MRVSVRPSDHPVVGHIQPFHNFKIKILRNGNRPGEMDEVEGGLGRFFAKADQDFQFLAKAVFSREFFWKGIKLFWIGNLLQ